MFASIRKVDRVQRDAVDEAGERGSETHDECDDAAPVGGEFGRVAIHAVKVVHVRDRDISTTSDVVATGRG